MTDSTADLAQVLVRAGVPGDELTPEELEEMTTLLATARKDPIKIVSEVLSARRHGEVATRNCEKAAEAATKLEGILEGLLDTDPVLCHLDAMRPSTGGPPRAVCRINGQLREVSVHPTVDVDELSNLEPWEFVLVRPDELIVVGMCRYDDLLDRARGSVVEFKGYLDRSRGLVRVARQGDEEVVVSLVQRLREIELTPSDKLILLQDDDRWAIDRVEGAHVRSRFEVPLSQVHTRFEDLAGLDPIIEPLLEDVILRLLHPELRDQYGLRPLNGLLLYSYKPGMGKTALMRAFAVWLEELGAEQDFDVVLYVVKPNELKIVWHGGDARLVREELCGSIRARQTAPRTRPLFQLVVLDEIDSLGKRGGMEDGALSTASNDAVQALLAEMDGMMQAPETEGPPAHVLWCGLTNRPDMLDEALKRPGRFGDLVLEIPDADQAAAEAILAIYGNQATIPWLIDNGLRSGVTQEELSARLLRPAVAEVFDKVVLRYATDSRSGIDVTAGEVMANAHFMEAMNVAKKRAARRELFGTGLRAVALDDIVDGLVEQACSAARQMDADRAMFIRQMKLKERVTRIDLVPERELNGHRYLRLHTA